MKPSRDGLPGFPRDFGSWVAVVVLGAACAPTAGRAKGQVKDAGVTGREAISATAQSSERGAEVVLPRGGMLRLAVHGLGSINCADMGPDGTVAAAGDLQGRVAVVTLGDGRVQWLESAHRGEVRALRFGGDGGGVLYSGGEDGRVVAWDANTGAVQGEIRAAGAPVRGLALSNGHLAVAAEQPEVELWREGKLSKLGGHTGWVRAVAFSPDGSTLASGGHDGSIRIWSVVDGTLQRTLEKQRLWIGALAFGPRGRYLVSGGFDKRVLLWDLQGKDSPRRLSGHVRRVARLAFDGTGRFVASAGLDRVALLWDATTAREAARLDGHRYQVSDVVFSPRGRFALTAAGDGYLRLWALPATASDVMAKLSDPGPGEVTLRNNTTGERGRVRLVDGKGRALQSGRKQLARLLRSMPDARSALPKPRLVELLFQVAEHFGRQREIVVISGYRSTEYNQLRTRQSRQVAKRSKHMSGEAMDLRIEGVTVGSLARYLREIKAGGVGFYPDSQFVHMDIGPVRQWGGN